MWGQEDSERFWEGKKKRQIYEKEEIEEERAETGGNVF